MGLLGDAAGLGVGMLMGQYEDKRQLKQQDKLNKNQFGYNELMAQNNDARARKFWEDTNYSAQRAQMEKAGLNVGLMYGGSGAGGTTAGAGSGSGVSGGSAAGSKGEAMAGASMAANIDLMKANAEKARAEAEAVGGYKKDLAGAEIDSKRLANALQGLWQNASGYEIIVNGEKMSGSKVVQGVLDGDIKNPAIQEKVFDMLKKGAEKDNILSRTLEQDMKNEARELGVTDIDDMYLRMGARYAIEGGMDKNDARFALVAAEAAVGLFEMFSGLGIAKNLKGAKQGGKME